MSKPLLEYCKSRSSADHSFQRHIARYYMIQTYLRGRHTETIWTYQSGNTPTCAEIDEFMGWQSHTTEKIVNDRELFTFRYTRDGWTCKELSWEKRGAYKKQEQEPPAEKESTSFDLGEVKSSEY